MTRAADIGNIEPLIFDEKPRPIHRSTPPQPLRQKVYDREDLADTLLRYGWAPAVNGALQLVDESLGGM